MGTALCQEAACKFQEICKVIFVNYGSDRLRRAAALVSEIRRLESSVASVLICGVHGYASFLSNGRKEF